MPKAGWDQVHNQRPPLLQLGSDYQRRGCRGYSEGEREGIKDWVDDHEPKLGSKLAVKCSFGGSVTIFQGHSQWSPQLHLVEHCPFQLAVLTDFHWKEFQGLTKSRFSQLNICHFGFLTFFNSIGKFMCGKEQENPGKVCLWGVKLFDFCNGARESERKSKRGGNVRRWSGW